MGWHGLISKDNLVLVVIDVQEKLFPLIFDRERILENIKKIVQFARIIKIPIILTEQYPRGLGGTIPELRGLIPGVLPIEKVEFSCFSSENFRERLREINAKTLILVGIETHICIMQTSIEGISDGYRICVVSDATSSRNIEDKNVAVERMRQSGVTVTSTEMLIYELLRKAGTQEFREALKLVKT
ncbi:MAG: hydrolase [Candidatus Bathyarchaeia archaeon]